MERGNPKSRVGVVVSNKMTKTVVVKVERRVADRKYGKITTKAEKYKAHDEEQACQIGVLASGLYRKVRAVKFAPKPSTKAALKVEESTKE